MNPCRALRLFSGLLLILLLAGCEYSDPDTRPWLLDATPSTNLIVPASVLQMLPTPRPAGSPYFTPTPDVPHALPALRSDGIQYTVQSGDYMSLIADTYNLPLASLIEANPGINPEMLEIGQSIFVPAPQPAAQISDFKIIPDSELVYGPVSANFDTAAFITQKAGYLSRYSETIEGQALTGAEIVQRIAYEYSVNPRLLLALLEYRSGWVTNPQPSSVSLNYPMGRFEETRMGLYKQLAWTADTLNRAYYLHKINGLAYVVLADNNLMMLSPMINAGTAAVQSVEAQLNDRAGYEIAISENGVFAVYSNFFGLPFDLTIDPLLPADLAQPALQLPFEPGVVWSFTGGPHGGWGDGSAWAALDFGPPGDTFGCFISDAWVVAAADGLITRDKDGAVVIDLDGDGIEQTGWTLLYMHVESRDRISAGTYVKAGDRIGHPSCEGGVSNGTHLHIARRYNGEWISADGNLPFNLDGWVSSGDGIAYDGTLTKEGQTVIAWDGRFDENQIFR